MGNMEEALKKAGLSESEPTTPIAPTEPGPPDLAAENPPADSPPAENPNATPAPAEEIKPETKPPTKPPTKPEAKKDHQCSKCGAVFVPKHPKHRLCPKCADEHFTARPPRGAERPERPTGAAGAVGTVEAVEKPAAAEKPVPATRPAPRRLPERDRPLRPLPQSAQDAAASSIGSSKTPPRSVVRSLPQSLPQDYLASGYFGSGGRVRDEVYTTWALRVADVLVERRLKSRQLRAFYNHVKRAGAALDAGRDIHLVRADILKIKPFAAERQGRGLVPAEFREFLDRNVDQVKDEKTLRAFAEHFQAVVGYATGRLKN